MISIKTLCLGLACSCLITVAQANLGDIDEDDLDNPLIVEGKELLQNEDWTAAITRFESALDATPNSADLHNFLGYAYRKSGDLDKAFLHYDKALEINGRIELIFIHSTHANSRTRTHRHRRTRDFLSRTLRHAHEALG